MTASQTRHSLVRYLITGATIGLLGVVLFGLIHAIVIIPIWTRLFGGVPFAVIAGLAMGWAFYELRPLAGPGPRGLAGMVFGFLMWVTLVPMTVFGVIVRRAGMHTQNDSWETIVEVVLALVSGAAAGRLIGGRWRPALALGIASLVLALTQAGPIPLTTTTRAARLFAGVAIIYLLCGLALGLLSPPLTPRDRDSDIDA